MTPEKNKKYFKYCAISLNMVHTGALCGVLGFTATLILISKNFQSKYIYTMNSAFCGSKVQTAKKALTFWCLIDMVVSYKPYLAPG